MIETRVTTVCQFDTVEQFLEYTRSDRMARITGFGEELRTAWDTKKPYVFKTPNPYTGKTVRSDVEVIEVHEIKLKKPQLTDGVWRE